jgi:hypothetical protein
MILFIQNLFFRDFWLKIFSLVLAILIWLTVWHFFISKDVSPAAALSTARSEDRVFYNIPVLVMSAAADVRDFKVSPGEVAIRVRGEPEKLQALEKRMRDDPQARDIRAMVDLTGIEPARGTRKKIVVTTPADITFEQAEPDEVEIIEPAKR